VLAMTHGIIDVPAGSPERDPALKSETSTLRRVLSERPCGDLKPPKTYPTSLRGTKQSSIEKFAADMSKIATLRSQ